ncbi:cupin domain-containing protein [Granulicella mallensis]|uniref:Cupin 2 conserved barrel domain protein n=1 Tax=Granulicella mallensis (strain ATCC BAA-1857 / DSM 23137 / MP5ACTX8) TaxID=682795 RepID=G8P0F4_GRAMM|nr:cupin domain-containing protein [Granulicella mallensis]AEU38042.1 Cupin 2 conserved barrel domain protein [Granulicella mallensis MP5ACTX8]
MSEFKSREGQAVAASREQIYQVLGVLQQFLVRPQEGANKIALIRGELPEGCEIPLHSHRDVEIFFIISGQVSIYVEGLNGSAWQTIAEGEAVSIPGGSKHALRAAGTTPADVISVTGGELFSFFEALAQPIAEGEVMIAPTMETMQGVFAAAAKYGIWLASPEENRAIGLAM